MITSLTILALLVGALIYSHTVGNKSSEENSVATSTAPASTPIKKNNYIYAPQVTTSPAQIEPSIPAPTNTNNTENSRPIPTKLLTSRDPSASNVIYNNYSELSISEYRKNPSDYLDSGIRFKTLAIKDFLPKDTTNETSNYIEVIDATGGQMMLQVDDTDYQTITRNFNIGDFMNIYGKGVSSHSFTTSNSFRTTNTIYPVATIQRIDKCSSGNCGNTDTTLLFDKLGTSTVSSTPKLVAIKTVILNATIYEQVPFSIHGIITGFMPYDNKGNYLVVMRDQNDPSYQLGVALDGTYYYDLKTGDTLEVTGMLAYIGLRTYDIDTFGSPIILVDRL
ncbi:MAG: hypothetical protein JWP09_785 [Candidatus Taylorbacteria bacterium]|nr:hypothetical protein [Candidatus Taylorbacteria bacterium]